MRILEQPTAAGRKVCLAIGMFDGVHLGHQQVIGRMIDDARQHEALAVVATFDCHPNAVVAPERTPKLIYPLARKLRVIESLGADATWLIHFNTEFSRKPADEFVREFVRGFGGVHSLCVGSGFTFGHKRAGNVALLRQLGQEMHFTVHGLASVALDGAPVSSTRIRECIRTGDFDDAGQMLGRAYSLCGVVKKGDQLGRRLGFPTANVDIEGLVVPPTGVYAVHVSIDGAQHRGVFNLGHCPTLERSEPNLQAEAHLFEFDADLYGRTVEISFVEKLREEQKFPSLDALRAQIERDVAAARGIFG
jgi:riboflavin kinase/FMN adenylyltransferase